jgi:hypothetical protein
LLQTFFARQRAAQKLAGPGKSPGAGTPSDN